jgi:AcrR family transcriptional regulator
MARPRSEEKQQAILAAAIEVIAEQGVAAPTAKIARQAGCAEGTLFTYYATKDDLLNELYLELKRDLADMMMAAYPSRGALRQRAQHVWRVFVDWGVDNPAKRRAMTQLGVSERVTEQTKREGRAAFEEIGAILQESVASGVLREYPLAFTAAIMESLAQTTMGFMEREPAQAERYRDAGFDAFWRAVAHK